MYRNYYTIMDKVAGQFGELMFCSSDEVAKREFISVIRKYHVNKDDMELYKVAIFDDEKGVLQTDERLVIKGSDIDVPNYDGLEEILCRLSTLEQICKDRKNA